MSTHCIVQLYPPGVYAQRGPSTPAGKSGGTKHHPGIVTVLLVLDVLLVVSVAVVVMTMQVGKVPDNVPLAKHDISTEPVP